MSPIDHSSFIVSLIQSVLVQKNLYIGLFSRELGELGGAIRISA
jgi:hypothetical protein